MKVSLTAHKGRPIRAIKAALQMLSCWTGQQSWLKQETHPVVYQNWAPPYDMLQSSQASDLCRLAVNDEHAHLVKVGYGLALPPAIKVWHIDKLVVICKARISPLVLWCSQDIGQVLQLLVPPVVELCQAWSCTPLSLRVTDMQQSFLDKTAVVKAWSSCY